MGWLRSAAAEGHQAADHEASGNGTDDDLLAVLADLAFPVRKFRYPVAKLVDRLPEFGPLGIYVRPDLL